MQDRFKFRAILKTDKYCIMVQPYYILKQGYYIDINNAETEFENKYKEECFWDFIDDIKKQNYIQEIACEADLIIIKDFTNLVQCTGLKDKNGKPIYEGDIVKCLSEIDVGYLGVIKFGKISTYQGFYVNWNTRHPILRGDLYYWLEDKEEGLEIISNVYENPELLEGKNEKNS